jgi:hypothetical protein
MSRFACPAAIVAGLLTSTISLTAQRAPTTPQTGLSPDILALACAPVGAQGRSDTPLRITGGQDSVTRDNYTPGDLLTLNAGAVNGIRVGQEFFVRRHASGRAYEPNGLPATMVQTAGWVRVWAVDETMSLLTVTHACDAIQVGDYLEPFKLPDAVVPNPNKPKAERENFASVVAGFDLRSTFGRGDFFTINRGAEAGIKPGAQFVVYRDKKENQNFLFELGEAVAVSVGDHVATLRVTMSRDALREGDYVAERK